MRFYEFIQILYNATSRPISKSDYVLEVFAAMCGEVDPYIENHKYAGKKIGSPKVPDGLRNVEESYRNGLYQKPKGNLSMHIKRHILDFNTPYQTVPFVTYLNNTVEDKFDDLCADLGVSDAINRSVLFEAIYLQFMRFTEKADDVDNIVPESIEIIENYCTLKLDDESLAEYLERRKILRLI